MDGEGCYMSHQQFYILNGHHTGSHHYLLDMGTYPLTDEVEACLEILRLDLDLKLTG